MIELFERFFRWLVRSIGTLTLVRTVLLSLAFIGIERGIMAVVGHIHPEWLTSTVIYAILVGWLFGRTHLAGWKSGLAGIGIGLVWLTLSVGQLSVPLNGLILSLPNILKQFIFRTPADFGPFLDAWTSVTQNLSGLAGRLMLWIHNAGTRTLIVDPQVTSIIWGLILWLAAIWAAWWIRRKEALGAGLLPATTLLVYNVYYTNSKNGIVWLTLTGGSWIFLQALESYRKHRRHWQQEHMGQTEIEPVLATAVSVIAAGTMLAGGLLPSISIQKISNAFQDIFQTQNNRNLAESLGLEQTPQLVSHGKSGTLGLSDTHSIGPGPNLSQEVEMYISVDGYRPPPPDEVLLHTAIQRTDTQYYWRSQTFEVYNGHIWISNSVLSQDIPANSFYHPTLISLPDNYRVVRQHVERLQPLDDALFVTGDLLRVDQPSIADWHSSGDLSDARITADTFTAESRVQSVSATQLRQARDDYPASLHNYLDLPDELPGRVRNLAIQLTTGLPTPYDQVMAIQTYLRQFPYSLDVPGVPEKREVADYFLFDLQKGYCDYFATTMAVMVRSIGIPARLVTGFSSGSYDYNEERFVVVQANAHSWVEVYFPGIGWVEFEPTTNLPAFIRTDETAGQSASAPAIPPPAPLKGSKANQVNLLHLRQPLLILEFILFGLAIFLIAWLILPIESWLLTLLPADKAILSIHHRLYRLGRNWGVPPDAARTPHEFAYAFSKKLDRFTKNPLLALLATSLQNDLEWLTGLYTRLLFSPHPPTRLEHLQAVRNWASIRKGLRKISRS